MSTARFDLAKALCRFAHEGQTDKAGAPYYLHPFIVADKVETEDEKIVAYLHDVVEDSNIGIDTLINLFGPKVAEAVVSVTRREGEAYMDFVRRAKLNPIGRKVKLADLEHNMDTSRLPEVTLKDRDRLEKYRAAVEFLQE